MGLAGGLGALLAGALPAFRGFSTLSLVGTVMATLAFVAVRRPRAPVKRRRLYGENLSRKRFRGIRSRQTSYELSLAICVAGRWVEQQTGA